MPVINMLRSEIFSIEKGKGIEMLINYEPRLHFIAEWWKQLFGESEGKDGKGIFPCERRLYFRSALS